MKIRIASALTKPVITDFDTKRMTKPSFRTTGADLQQAGQHGRGQQVLQPVIAHQRDHQDRGRGGGGRDHAGPSARMAVMTAIEKEA